MSDRTDCAFESAARGAAPRDACAARQDTASPGSPGRADAPLLLTPVVLAGGAGTRLWPVSREQCPKQLLGIVGSESMLQQTVQRVLGMPDGPVALAAMPIVVCSDAHRLMTRAQLDAIGAPAQIIAEPGRRGTAPALTLAAATAWAVAGDSILVVMPADHMIADTAAFRHALERAARHARDGAIVALGIPPARPDSGLGYVKLGAGEGSDAFAIERFVEKPAEELAAQYVASGGYWWNSGIFVVRASVWLQTLARLQPAMHAACLSAVTCGTRDGMFFFPSAPHYAEAPSDSIDYAVMERLDDADFPARGVVVKLEAGWSDLGSWNAVWDALEKDENDNVARGRVVFETSQSSFAHSDGRLVACVGVKDIVVVDTDDAVLVADRSRIQDVKALVDRIRASDAPEAHTHRKVRRPWGYYDSIDRGERFQVKRIVVDPGGRLSLQLHHHRAEHWIVVRGTARVVRGEDELLLSENESTFIPLGVKHQLENPGKVPLEIIEVQSGGYLGEDDIVRFDDKYGRV